MPYIRSILHRHKIPEIFYPMQEKKTLFVGQIVAQFDLVSTTSRLRASQNLLVPSLLRTQSQRKGLWEGRKNQVSSARRLC